MKKLALILAAVIAIPQVTSAQFSGNDIQEYCSETDSLETDSICFFYIIGVIEGLNAGHIKGTTRLADISTLPILVSDISIAMTPYCFPKGNTRRQVVDTAKMYLTNHPEKRHLSAASLINTAMQEAFPCPETEE